MSELPESDRIARAQDIVTHMTGNANFSTPNPTLAAVQTRITTANTKMAAAVAALTAARVATQEKRDAIAAVVESINQLAMYVENIANGNEAIILSAGFELRAPPLPVGELPAPTGLESAPGTFPGQLVARWDVVPGSVIYELQTSPDPNLAGSWVARGTSTKSSATLNGLPSGGPCWLRVRAIGAAGPSPYSDPAMKTVP